MNSSLVADPRPLIVSARLDPASQTYFDQLRRQHFPLERNHLAAHLTMFHALPGDGIEEVNVVLTEAANRGPSPHAEVCGVRSLGNGVAFTICSPDLERLREEIASSFRNRLTRQDAQRWRPHITVQNKVTPDSARELLKVLTGAFEPWTVSVEGVDLWHYDGGPWELVQSFRFKIRR
jgi:2'-5' RNA ligase